MHQVRRSRMPQAPSMTCSKAALWMISGRCSSGRSDLDRHVRQVDHVDGRSGRIVDLREPRAGAQRVQAGVVLVRGLVHCAPAGTS